MADTPGKTMFPDPDRPLYTPDPDAQQQVAERIKQGMQGRKATKGQAKPDMFPGGISHSAYEWIAHGGYHELPNQCPPLRMGKHPKVTRDMLAKEWGMGHTKAQELARHPEDMDPWQVRTLCNLCGVTLEWLRGWDAENGFGRYESADVIADAYGQLSTSDKELVTQLISRLVGADVMQKIERSRWISNCDEWALRHPEEAARAYGEGLDRLERENPQIL